MELNQVRVRRRKLQILIFIWLAAAASGVVQRLAAPGHWPAHHGPNIMQTSKNCNNWTDIRKVQI